MKIKVFNSKMNSHDYFNLCETDNISKIKKKVSSKFKYKNTKLIFSGKLLKDEDIIKDIGLKDGFTLIAVDNKLDENSKPKKNLVTNNIPNSTTQNILSSQISGPVTVNVNLNDISENITNDINNIITETLSGTFTTPITSTLTDTLANSIMNINPSTPNIQSPENLSNSIITELQQYLNNIVSSNISQNFNPYNEITQEDEEKYELELTNLTNMGFNNKVLNINALKYCEGNVEDAVNIILTYN